MKHRYQCRKGHEWVQAKADWMRIEVGEGHEKLSRTILYCALCVGEFYEANFLAIDKGEAKEDRLP